LFYILLMILSFQNDDIDPGLDLNEITEIASKVKSAEELERRLNSFNSKDIINNLDLNQDGIIDYIDVEEERIGSYRDGKIIYKLSVDEIQIATVSYEPDTDDTNHAHILIVGHQRYYGPRGYYRFRVKRGFYPYWTQPYWARPIYRSPYRFQINTHRRYPNYWKKRNVVARNTYLNHRNNKLKRQNHRIKKQNTKLRNKKKRDKQKNVKNKARNKTKNKNRN
jgi:hypothetical protein